MSEPTLTCPHCQTTIKLTESLAAPLIETTRRAFQAQLARKEEEIGGREAALRAQQAELARARNAVEAEVAARLEAERKRIAGEEAARARQVMAEEIAASGRQLAELQDVLRQRDAKLAEAQQAQAELMRKERALDDAKRELELNVQKQVQAELEAVRAKARREAEESQALKLAEKDEKMASLNRQIEELRRRAEQGSQQLQGEAQELELEALLRQKFPRDLIEPVPKGEYGGDILQRVVGPSDRICGTILWEAKRTKNWSDGWLAKLRDDQRAARADIALIVSHALPKGLESFDHIDGIWVTEPRCAPAMAIALRYSLLELSNARLAREGQQTKMELVYDYLTGPRFRHRISAIVERFTLMQEDLDRERRATQRLWAKREEQIRGVIEATTGMYGDLQGIAGRSFQEIEGLEIPLIDAEPAC
jgi:hypothetical protein